MTQKLSFRNAENDHGMMSRKCAGGWIGGWKVMVSLALISKEKVSVSIKKCCNTREEMKNGKYFRNSSIDGIGHS